MSDTYEIIKTHLAEIIGVDERVLDDDTQTLLDIGVDSLLMVEFAFELEQKFNIRIDDSLPMEKMTLREVCEYIDDLLRPSVTAGMDGQ